MSKTSDLSSYRAGELVSDSSLTQKDTIQPGKVIFQT